VIRQDEVRFARASCARDRARVEEGLREATPAANKPSDAISSFRPHSRRPGIGNGAVRHLSRDPMGRSPARQRPLAEAGRPLSMSAATADVRSMGKP